MSLKKKLFADDLQLQLQKKIFTPEKNNPVTKGDIEELKKMVNTRFLPVINITYDFLGRKAYYDKETGQIVFYNAQLNRYELPMTDL